MATVSSASFFCQMTSGEHPPKRAHTHARVCVCVCAQWDVSQSSTQATWPAAMTSFSQEARPAEPSSCRCENKERGGNQGFAERGRGGVDICAPHFAPKHPLPSRARVRVHEPASPPAARQVFAGVHAPPPPPELCVSAGGGARSRGGWRGGCLPGS